MNYALIVLKHELEKVEDRIFRINVAATKNPTASFPERLMKDTEKQTAELKKAIRLINKKLK